MPHSEMTKQKLKLFGCGSLTASLFKDTIFRSRKKASAEMIPNLIRAPEFFGLQEIWSMHENEFEDTKMSFGN